MSLNDVNISGTGLVPAVLADGIVIAFVCLCMYACIRVCVRQPRAGPRAHPIWIRGAKQFG